MSGLSLTRFDRFSKDDLSFVVSGLLMPFYVPQFGFCGFIIVSERRLFPGLAVTYSPTS